MKRRTGNDIWKGLYDFPLIETDKKTEIKKILSHSKTKKLLGSNFHVIKISAPHSHLLSHQKLHSVFIEIIPKTKVRNKNLVPYSSDFAVPRLIEKYLYSQ
jgi:A/G-specific adenine glycosylase